MLRWALGQAGTVNDAAAALGVVPNLIFRRAKILGVDLAPYTKWQRKNAKPRRKKNPPDKPIKPELPQETQAEQPEEDKSISSPSPPSGSTDGPVQA